MIIIANNLLPGCDFKFETGQLAVCNGETVGEDLLLKNVIDQNGFLLAWVKNVVNGFESIVEGVYVYQFIETDKVLFYPRKFEGFAFVDGVKYSEARLIDLIAAICSDKTNDSEKLEASSRAMLANFRVLAKSIDDTVNAGYPLPLYAPKGDTNVHERDN